MRKHLNPAARYTAMTSEHAPDPAVHERRTAALGTLHCEDLYMLRLSEFEPTTGGDQTEFDEVDPVLAAALATPCARHPGDEGEVEFDDVEDEEDEDEDDEDDDFEEDDFDDEEEFDDEEDEEDDEEDIDDDLDEEIDDLDFDDEEDVDDDEDDDLDDLDDDEEEEEDDEVV